LLISQIANHGSKKKNLSSKKLIAALSYLLEHLKFRDRLAEDYSTPEDQALFCPQISIPVSLNLFLRLVSEHIIHCKGLYSGSLKPNASAFLKIISEIYLKLV
jgi:hypothetical protein